MALQKVKKTGNQSPLMVTFAEKKKIAPYKSPKSCYRLRRTGTFLPGGGEPFAQKFSQVAQIFTKQTKTNKGHMML